ncbi:hypothetical protein J3A83DRAFT_4186918 [Scleroderma citrinum]
MQLGNMSSVWNTRLDNLILVVDKSLRQAPALWGRHIEHVGECCDGICGHNGTSVPEEAGDKTCSKPHFFIPTSESNIRSALVTQRVLRSVTLHITLDLLTNIYRKAPMASSLSTVGVNAHPEHCGTSSVFETFGQFYLRWIPIVQICSELLKRGELRVICSTLDARQLALRNWLLLEAVTASWSTPKFGGSDYIRAFLSSSGYLCVFGTRGRNEIAGRQFGTVIWEMYYLGKGPLKQVWLGQVWFVRHLAMPVRRSHNRKPELCIPNCAKLFHQSTSRLANAVDTTNRARNRVISEDIGDKESGEGHSNATGGRRSPLSKSNVPKVDTEYRCGR